jgi:ligand-binding sensor domain-containing protein
MTMAWNNSSIYSLILGVLISLASCQGRSGSEHSKTTDLQNTLGNRTSVQAESIWTIYQDTKSDFWFGSKDNGVFRYDGSLLTHFTKKDGLVSNAIRGIQEDTEGNIFFETTSGINVYDGRSFRLLKVEQTDGSSGEWELGSEDLWFSAGYPRSLPSP